MNDVLAMRVIEGTRHFACDADGVGDRELAFAFESRAQRLAGHEWHHVVPQAVGTKSVTVHATRGVNALSSS